MPLRGNGLWRRFASAVLRRLLGDKAVKMILVEGETKNTTRNIPTPKADRARFCLTDSDVLELAGR